MDFDSLRRDGDKVEDGDLTPPPGASGGSTGDGNEDLPVPDFAFDVDFAPPLVTLELEFVPRFGVNLLSCKGLLEATILLAAFFGTEAVVFE